MPKNDKSMIQSSILLHTTVDKQFWVNKIVKISTMINENLNNTQDLEMINNQSLNKFSITTVALFYVTSCCL